MSFQTKRIAIYLTTKKIIAFTNRNKKQNCPEFPHFGATYPDAICFDGLLWDLDSGDEPGMLDKGGEDPCPFCNTRAYVKDMVDNEINIKRVFNHIKFINAKYN